MFGPKHSDRVRKFNNRHGKVEFCLVKQVKGTSWFLVHPLFSRVEEECELAENRVGTEKGEMRVCLKW